MKGLECCTKELGHDSTSRRVLGMYKAHSELCIISQKGKGGLKEVIVGGEISKKAFTILLSRSKISSHRLTTERWRGGDDRNMQEVEDT